MKHTCRSVSASIYLEMEGLCEVGGARYRVRGQQGLQTSEGLVTGWSSPERGGGAGKIGQRCSHRVEVAAKLPVEAGYSKEPQELLTSGGIGTGQ